MISKNRNFLSIIQLLNKNKLKNIQFFKLLFTNFPSAKMDYYLNIILYENNYILYFKNIKIHRLDFGDSTSWRNLDVAKF